MKKAGNFENNEESSSFTSKKRKKEKKEEEMKEHAQKKIKNEEDNNEKNNIEKLKDNDRKGGDNEEDEKKGDNFYNIIKELEDIEINENENKANSSPIKNIKELSGALGLKLINKDIMEKEEEENKNSNIIDNQIKDIEKENLEEYKNKINYYNNEFNLLKQKCNTIYQNIEEEKSIRDNYKKLLEDISMQTFSLTENNIIENESKKEKNNILDEIYDVIHDTSSLIDELDKIIYNISNSFSKNIENLLNKIHENLIIDNKSYQKKEEYKNIIETIEKTMDEIKKICNVYEENKNKIGKIEDEIWEKIIFLVDKIMILKDQKNEKNMNDKKESSFLYKIKSGSIDLKSFNLFDILDNDNNYENADYPRLLRQNWQEICYIYDDYDIHDINYTIKAIGFKGDQKAKIDYLGLPLKAKHEILSLYIDGMKSKYKYLDKVKMISFDIDLSNLETKKVHIIYKQFFDYDALPADKIELEKKIIKKKRIWSVLLFS